MRGFFVVPKDCSSVVGSGVWTLSRRHAFGVTAVSTSSARVVVEAESSQRVTGATCRARGRVWDRNHARDSILSARLTHPLRPLSLIC